MVVLILLVLCLGGAQVLAGETTGRILCAYWRELPGNTVAELAAAPAFPKLPSEQVYLEAFETPADQENNFGTQVRGYLHPPAGGAYTFWISGDDQCELWLSPGDDPAKKEKIAEVPAWSLPKKWDQDPKQKSKPVELQAGRRYYLEALHKDGGGDNHLAVAWTLPDGTLEAPIPGTCLSPAAMAEIPPPRLSFDSSAPLPEKPGAHRIKANLEYRGQTLTIPVLVTLPDAYRPGARFPLLLYLHDGDQVPDAEGFRIQGPDRSWQTNPWFRKACRFIGVSPQCPAGKDWGQRVMVQAVVALLDQVLEKFPVERRRVYASGSGAGGTAVWRVALEKPELFAALAPVCGLEVQQEDLAERLNGIPILLVTGRKNGFATGCAVRMQERLEKNVPKPELYYEEEIESEAAVEAYDGTWFYAWLVSKQRAAESVPAAAAQRTPVTATLYARVALVAGALLLAAAMLRLFRHE